MIARVTCRYVITQQNLIVQIKSVYLNVKKFDCWLYNTASPTKVISAAQVNERQNGGTGTLTQFQR